MTATVWVVEPLLFSTVASVQFELNGPVIAPVTVNPLPEVVVVTVVVGAQLPL